MVMKPPPPSPLIHGSSTDTLKAAVTAASTAFPPRSSMSRAASTAHGCFAATMCRGATARLRETFSAVRASMGLGMPHVRGASANCGPLPVGPARGPRAALRARELRQAPGGERVDGRAERAAAVGQLVLDARRALAVGAAFDEAFALQALQALGQDVGRDLLGRIEKLAETALAGQQVADHQQRPAIADHVEGAGDRTGGAPPRRARLRRR